MAETQRIEPAVIIHGATLPIHAELIGSVLAVEFHAATGDVVLVRSADRIVCSASRVVRGETGDGRPFDEVAGALYLDAADRQNVPVTVL